MTTCLENVICEVCASADFTVSYFKNDKFQIEKEPFRVVSCAGCGLSYINPRPALSEIGKFYPEHYQWKEDPAGSAPGIAARLEKLYRYHQLASEINRLRKNIPFPAKILDIGCGTGDRLELLRKAGCDVYGVETSDQALHAVNHFKLRVFKGLLEDARYESNQFDIITLYNVLEHIHSPRKILKEIRRILKPGGRLVVEVPNNRSLQARFFKSRWAAADVPRDLYYFDASTLTKLLQASGFEVQKIDYNTDFWHPPTLVISLFPDLDPQLIWAKDKVQGNTLLSRVFWGLWTIALAPPAYLENKIGRGSLMTCFTVKTGEKI